MKERKTKILPQKDVYPMRINKYLAHKGVATRTGVDDLITHQKVLINGQIAKLGDKVSLTDKVEVRGVHTKKELVYLAFNKPKGVVSTNAVGTEEEIISKLKLDTKVFPVGRLDKESHGLIMLTNDGRITDRLLNPQFNHEKEYEVEVDRKYTPAFLKHMQSGVDIGECITRKALVKKIDDKKFNITLTEGKNRQIRRMTEKLGYTVRDLKRIRVQNIKIENVKPNSYRKITGEELGVFLKSIGL